MTSSGGGSGGGTAHGFSDWFFSYETFKVLRVRDRRLGGIYRLFQATILIYITTTIIYQQRYLKTENIVNGAVRISLKAPSDGLVTSSYCKPPARPCLYWSENDILYQPGVDGALITTRAKVTQYGPFDNHTVNQCDVNLPTVDGCDPYKAPSTQKLPVSLVTDVERFTIMLEHSIRGEATGIQLRSGNMQSGVLRHYKTGEVLRTFTNESRTVVQPSTNNTGKGEVVRLAGDVMTVGEFLRASGVNLDEVSTAPSASPGESVRSAGVVIIVVIKYAAQGWNPDKISYEYLPKAISDQEYKIIETLRDLRDGSRVEINRHGIRIVFSQTGQLGQFSLMALLTNLVAAVALFKVANIIVELMMLRIHPRKKVYVRAKFENTKDGNAGGKGGKPKQETFVPQVDSDDIQDEVEQGSANHTARNVEHRSFNRGGRAQDSDQRDKLSQDDQDGHESSSENDESEQEIIEQLGVRRRVVKASPESEDVSVNRSCSTGARIIRPRVMATEASRISPKEGSRDSSRRLGSLRSGGGIPGKSFDPATKSTFGMTLMDLSKNGSSSALIGYGTPGVAGSSARHCRESLDDLEIETRFGVLRPNDLKRFDPEGLSLSGTNVHPSISHTESGLISRVSLSNNRSSTTIRRASLGPVSFGQGHDKDRCLLKEARHRSRRHAALKSGASLKAPRPSSPSSISCDNFFNSPADPHKGDTGKSVVMDTHGYKKRRKESRVLPTRSKSEASMTRPLFGLGGSHDQTTLSLSGGADVKGKQRDQSDLPTLVKEPSSSQSAFKNRMLSCDDKIDPDTVYIGSTVVLGVSMAPSQSPTSTCLNQGASLDSRKFSTESQGLDGTSFASLGKQPVRSRPHMLRLSASSPNLLERFNPSSSTNGASRLVDGPTNIGTHGSLRQEPSISMETTAMAPMDLPARYADWRFPTQDDTSTSKALDVVAVCSSKEHGVSSDDLSSTPTDPAVRSESASVMSTTPDTTDDTSTTAGTTDGLISTTPTPCVADTDPLPARPLPTPTATPLTSQGVSTTSNGMTARAQHSLSSSSLSVGPTTTRVVSANDRTNVSRVNPNLASTMVRATTSFTSNSAISTNTTTGSYCYHTSNNFFTSPITAGCMTTLTGTGAHVLGRSITMITADNKKLVLRRSRPLVLCDGVGEEKAARM